MRILIACEESQRVCMAFRSLGHEAYSCDIQDQSGGYPEYHIIGDALKEAYSCKYDMMIAFPPCTYLSNAGARFLYPKGNLNHKRYQKGLKAKKFFLALYNAPIKHICIENPTPSRIYNLPEPTQVIQPYQYGESYSKRTQLWLKRLPALIPTKIIHEYEPFVKSSKHRGSYQPPKEAKTKKGRSKTFQGIANAMSEQWNEPKYIEQLKLW